MERQLHINLWKENPLAFWLMPSREEMLEKIKPYLNRTDRAGELTRRNARLLTASMEGYSLDMIVRHNEVLAAWWKAIDAFENDADTLDRQLARLGL